ncbi:MAG: efflux RND transporter periplasmic adaptor subunit [Planctomycetaceae bacterium]
MKRALVFLVVSAALVGALVFSQQRRTVLMVSGILEADEIRVGSRVGGRVLRVLVEEGDAVSAGDVLVELEPFDLLERRSEAQQMLAQATATFEKLSNGYRPQETAQAAARRDQMAAALEKLRNGPRPQEITAAESNLQLAEAELDLAERNYRRIESLFGKQATDKEDLDTAQTRLKVTQAAVDARTSELNLLKEGTRAEDLAQAEARLKEAQAAFDLSQAGFRAEEVQEAKARRDAASATVQAIERQLQELKIVSPTSAVVEALELQPGDLLAANSPAVSLLDVQRLRVRAYVPENHLDLKIGQSVDVRIDSYPDRIFPGEISFIARQAEFTPSNVQTPEERSRQVFRIRVRLPDPSAELRPGMAADVILESPETAASASTR